MNLYEKMKSGIYVIVKIQTYTADTLTIDCDDSKYVIIRICQQLYFSDTLFS